MATQTPPFTTLLARVTTIDGLPNETSPSFSDSFDSEEEEQDFNDAQSSDVKAFNYYFLLLAMLVLLVALFLWIIHWWRKRQRDRLRQSGQQALARDLEGWQNAQRLMHGRYRANGAVLVQRDEGLNEHGEAPPPYLPKTEGAVEEVTIPLRTLSRGEAERSRPPQYYESLPAHNPTPATGQEARYT
jgi:hypothetical protein